MEPAEISQLITELEERVERLRALYDQYFMGIERLEPTILRKDVDRRLWALRREQIRNTGLRFKLETTIQRYNTYQQYWQRIVREIENGTYQRDLGRAAQRFGEGAVTAFARRRQKMFEKGMAKKAEREAQRSGRASTPPEAKDAAGSHAAESPANESYDVDFNDSDMIEQQPLSLDFGGSSLPPPPASSKLTAVSPGTLREVSPANAAPAAPPSPLPAPRPAPPGLRSPTGALPRPAPQPPLPSVPAFTRSPAPAFTPSPAPAAPPAPAAAPATTAVAPRPALAATQPRPIPKPPEPRPPAVSSPDDGLSATRLRQIYGQYVEAKRKANESTAAITFDKVAANLRQTATQLQAKHKGTIDFEVVMKNGKPVLKPVVKG